jgi:rsbT antagonist protein RsbS
MNHGRIAKIDAIPIIQLWGSLIVPLQGDISDPQAEWLRHELLRRVRASDVTGIVIDTSGVAVIDSHLCALFASLVAAAELMGVKSVLSGLSPEIVMTLQAMAIELADIETALSLEAALERLGSVPGSSRQSAEPEFDEDAAPAQHWNQHMRSGQ